MHQKVLRQIRVALPLDDPSGVDFSHFTEVQGVLSFLTSFRSFRLKPCVNAHLIY